MTIFAGDSRFCYGRTVHEGAQVSPEAAERPCVVRLGHTLSRGATSAMHPAPPLRMHPVCAPCSVHATPPHAAAGTPTSIRHWQLRDLVSFGPCPDGDQVYAVYDTCVMSYPTPTARQLHERQQQQASSSNGGDPHVVAATAASSPRPRIVMNVDFYASCMTYWGGFLAAGGQQGEVRDGVPAW